MYMNRGVARIFGLGVGAHHVVWSPTLRAPKLRSPWVLPQKNFADPNAWNAFSQHLTPSP